GWRPVHKRKLQRVGFLPGKQVIRNLGAGLGPAGSDLARPTQLDGNVLVELLELADMGRLQAPPSLTGGASRPVLHLIDGDLGDRNAALTQRGEVCPSLRLSDRLRHRANGESRT